MSKSVQAHACDSPARTGAVTIRSTQTGTWAMSLPLISDEHLIIGFCPFCGQKLNKLVAKKKVSSTIHWAEWYDPERGRGHMFSHGEYDAGWLASMNKLVPDNQRFYRPHLKSWFVCEAYASKVIDMHANSLLVQRVCEDCASSVPCHVWAAARVAAKRHNLGCPIADRQAYLAELAKQRERERNRAEKADERRRATERAKTDYEQQARTDARQWDRNQEFGFGFNHGDFYKANSEFYKAATQANKSAGKTDYEQGREREKERAKAKARAQEAQAGRDAYDFFFGGGRGPGSSRGRPSNAAADVVSAIRTLGLSWPCTPAEVKKAYRDKAMKTHPDHGGDEEAFKKVGSAKAILDAAVGT